MHVRAAVLASAALASASFFLLWAANEATDKSAVAGGIGLIIAGSLLGLSLLAVRWDRERMRRYVETYMEVGTRAEDAGAPATGDASSRDDDTGRASAI